MAVHIDEFVEHCAFELTGLHPDDQAACLAAAAESLAEYLYEQKPWLREREIRAACTELVKRVRAKLDAGDAGAASRASLH